MKKLVPYLLSLLMLAACQQEEELQDEMTATTIKEVFSTGGVPEEVQSVEEEEVLGEEEVLLPDGSTWKCTTTRVSVTEGSSDFPLFNPNASVIYPGSLLQGGTLQNATPSVIPVRRAGGTISIDIIDGSAQPSFEVEEVSKSAIATAANQIIGESSGTVPANFNFSAEQVYSKEQMALSLGVNVETQFVTVASQLDFSQDKEYNRFIVKLNQSFYTLSFDIPTSLSQLFAPDVTAADLAKYVGPGNPATYISDVTYGRIYYMLVESSSSAMEIDAAISASFSGATAGGGVDIETNYLRELSDLQIKVVALGGESRSTFATIGETDLANLVSLLGESTDIASGVPISYVVRSALNNEVVNTKLAAEYDRKECIALSTPLGDPILWFDASDLMVESNQNPCTDCLDGDGFFRYYGPNDSFAHDNHKPTPNADGTVVRRWRDLSGNELHASSVSNEPNSRPLFVEEAFDNGLPAVEFVRYHPYDIHNRMTYSGSVFVNTDYTIFAVVSYKERVKIEIRDALGRWFITDDVPNRYGYFMMGNGDDERTSLWAGFQNQHIFRLSHRKYGLYVENPDFQPSSEFVVLAMRFSREEGMSVYQNGVLIARDPSKKQALISNHGAMITAPYSGHSVANARIRIGEIMAYGVAATEAQILQQTVELQQKYGL